MTWVGYTRFGALPLFDSIAFMSLAADLFLSFTVYTVVSRLPSLKARERELGKSKLDESRRAVGMLAADRSMYCHTQLAHWCDARHI